MEPLELPKTLKIYQLLKQNKLYFSPVGSSAGLINQLGIGFFLSRAEAEYSRTMEILKKTSMDTDTYHVFELDIPNPAYTN